MNPSFKQRILQLPLIGKLAAWLISLRRLNATRYSTVQLFELHRALESQLQVLGGQQGELQQRVLQLVDANHASIQRLDGHQQRLDDHLHAQVKQQHAIQHHDHLLQQARETDERQLGYLQTLQQRFDQQFMEMQAMREQLTRSIQQLAGEAAGRADALGGDMGTFRSRLSELDDALVQASNANDILTDRITGLTQAFRREKISVAQ